MMEDPTMTKLRNMQDRGGRRAPSRSGRYIIGKGKGVLGGGRTFGQSQARGESPAAVFWDRSSNGSEVNSYWRERRSDAVLRTGWRGALDRARGVLVWVISSPFLSTSGRQSGGREGNQRRNSKLGGITPYRFSDVIPMEGRNVVRSESVYFMDGTGMIRKSSYPQSPSRRHSPPPVPAPSTPIPPVPPMTAVPASTHLAHSRSLSPSGPSHIAPSLGTPSQSDHSPSASHASTYPIYNWNTPSIPRPPAYNYQHAPSDPPRAVNDPFYSYYNQANTFFDPAETNRRGIVDRWRLRLSKSLPPTPADTPRNSLQPEVQQSPPPARSPALLD